MISAVLTQEGAPVGYFSAKLSSSELNYSINEKETLAVVHTLVHWKTHLHSPFLVFTDSPVVRW